MWLLGFFIFTAMIGAVDAGRKIKGQEIDQEDEKSEDAKAEQGSRASLDGQHIGA